MSVRCVHSGCWSDETTEQITHSSSRIHGTSFLICNNLFSFSVQLEVQRCFHFNYKGMSME